MADIAIIGAGTAGLTAAIYARRGGMDTVVYEAEAYGGQIINTPEIENYPGLMNISGFEFATKLYEQAAALGARIEFDKIVKIERKEDGTFTLKGGYGTSEDCKAVIIATGAKNRPMGLDGEEKLTGKGISYCATCDGSFYKGKTVAVFGGGNTAVEDAIYLADICSRVYIIHRRDEFRADRAAIAQALANPKIEPVYNTIVEKIEGDGMVENLVLKNVRTGEKSNLPVSGVFMFVGQEPDDDCVRGLVKAEKGGWIITNDHMETSVEGIFAAGDVRSKYLRQVITAAADGAVAAMAASSYINEQLHLRSTLLEPDEVKAFFYSSIDEAQVKLSNAVEKCAKAKGVKVPVIDGYRNARMTEKLGISDKLPAVAVIKKGTVEKVTTLKSESEIENALA